MKHFLVFIGQNSNMATSGCKLTFLNYGFCLWVFFFFNNMNMLILNPIWLHGAAAMNEFPIKHMVEAFRTAMCHQLQQYESRSPCTPGLIEEDFLVCPRKEGAYR